jgi:mono/diheme cytochrome c family protein
MIYTAQRFVALFTFLLFCTAVAGFGQEKTVKREPVRTTAANSGEEMFKSYCAACHGKDAKGAGPATADLKTTPPDLTTLAKRHDGKFPADYVTTVLRNGVKAPAHGTSDMPVWGPLLASVSSHDEAIVSMRIANLVHYIESLQEK